MKNVEYAESEHQNQFYFNKGISSKIKIVRSFFSQLAQLDCSKDCNNQNPKRMRNKETY